MNPPRTCLLVEDQPEARDWLRAAVGQAFEDIQVTAVGGVREARAWLEGADGLARLDLDLAIIDLGLPDGAGVDVITWLAARSPGTLSVVATIYDDDAHLFAALAAGARGYLLKDEEPERLCGYLRRIARGEPPLSPSIAHRLLAHFRGARPADDELRLSGRETEVLTLLARGMTVAEAAAALGLKPQTVASYVKIIYQKLNVTSRAEATVAAVRRGLA